MQVENHLWFKKAGRVLEGLYTQTQQVKETFISLYEHSDISHEEESITRDRVHKQIQVPTCNQ